MVGGKSHGRVIGHEVAATIHAAEVAGVPHIADLDGRLQRRLAKLAIDCGAQVVIGHHPHVLQGVEFYNGGVIYYSLGNFAFGSYSRNAKTGGLARVTLSDGGVKTAEILPLNVLNHEVLFQPKPLDADTEFATDFAELCAPLGADLVEKSADGFWNLREMVPQVAMNDSATSTQELTTKNSKKN